ncbi:MAG: hypothetical protein HUJ86_06270 [Synergistes sp.]|nr:hypothetical protein [Synergistes sp.]
MTELENAVPFSAIDPLGRVKFSVLLGMFQEMADVDALRFGLSISQIIDRNITWVLHKYRVVLDKYPTKESGSLTINTYAEPHRNLYSLRSFKIKDSRGEFIGSAYTWWVLLDIEKQRPMRLDKNIFSENFAACCKENPYVTNEPVVKIASITEPDIIEPFKVRWQELDVNGHTNNIVYFDWALDTVPDDVTEKLSPHFVEAEFIHSVPRTRVRCLTQEIPDESGRTFLHSLRHSDDETEYARLYSKWR